MTATVDLPRRHLEIARAILAACLRPTAQAFVFGSRGTGRARGASDLDLAIDAGRPPTRPERLDLAEGFDESDLPWRVDVVDLHAASDGFKAIVLRDMVALPTEPRATRRPGAPLQSAPAASHGRRPPGASGNPGPIGAAVDRRRGRECPPASRRGPREGTQGARASP